MLKNILESVKSLASEKTQFDSSIFDDPIARTTAWTPAKGGGASFCTHKLRQITPSRFEFRASWGAKIFYLAFLLVGVGVMTGFTCSWIFGGSKKSPANLLFPLVFGGIFSLLGACMYYCGTKPFVFDKESGNCWKGSKDPNKFSDDKTVNSLTKLSQIHAIQLVSERCSGKNSSYYSYELNLILQDGSRVNVSDHGNFEKLLEDAKILADFLRVPVWNAVNKT